MILTQCLKAGARKLASAWFPRFPQFSDSFRYLPTQSSSPRPPAPQFQCWVPIHTLSCNLGTTCFPKSCWIYLDAWLWGVHPREKKAGFIQIPANSKFVPPTPCPPIPMLSSNTYFVLQFRNHMFSKIVLNLFGCMTLRGPSPGEKSGIHSDTCQLKVSRPDPLPPNSNVDNNKPCDMVRLWSTQICSIFWVAVLIKTWLLLFPRIPSAISTLERWGKGGGGGCW